MIEENIDQSNVAEKQTFATDYVLLNQERPIFYWTMQNSPKRLQIHQTLSEDEYEFTENAEKLIFELDGEMVTISSTYSSDNFEVKCESLNITL